MKTLTLEVGCGTSIVTACRQAVSKAVSSQAYVRFDFNGIEMIATPQSNSDNLESEWSKKLEIRAETYRNSPEGRQAALDAEVRSNEAKYQTDICMSALPFVLRENSLDSLMNWLRKFTEAADHVDAEYSTQEVIERLEGAGYARGYGVGNPEDWFNNRERMGRYIVGQSLDCLHNGMPPHQVLFRFVDEYFEMPV